MKQKIKVGTYSFSGITSNKTLGEILTTVQSLISQYGEDAEIDFDSGYNNISEEIFYWREETDAEYQQRLEYEAEEVEHQQIRKEKQEAKDRKEFERLKAKYGE